MDNFEHVLDGAAFVQEILSAAPRVQILATSRVRLNLMSETVFNIGGLTIGAAAVEQNSAIQLFVQSAKRTRPQFELNDDGPARGDANLSVGGGNAVSDCVGSRLDQFPYGQGDLRRNRKEH